ncbi:unnamed protein product [Thelazia callipaeda]|uniref:Homeobox domain-containing protein n=1 Tax=Thelazia callipaeda TaxID=103827 RepID=A0A158RBU1_THECL|nr:unnamed protein product [Thelazia callipaeda]
MNKAINIRADRLEKILCRHCQKRFSHSGSYSSHMSSKKCTAAAAQASSSAFGFGDQMILYRTLLLQFQTAHNLAYSNVTPYAALLQQQLLQAASGNNSLPSPSTLLANYWACHLSNSNHTTKEIAPSDAFVKNEMVNVDVRRAVTNSTSAVTDKPSIEGAVHRQDGSKGSRSENGEHPDSKDGSALPISNAISDESPGGTWKPLRSRSFLTDAQVAILHAHFKRNPFPSKYELSAVAAQIGVNKRVVQVWFQNTRAKERRSNRLSVACERYSRSIWNNAISFQSAATAIAAANDPLNLMAGWAQQCTGLVKNRLSDEQMGKADLSSSKPSDAVCDLPLDLSVKDDSAVIRVAVSTRHASPVSGVGGNGENQDDCWSPGSLSGSLLD